jgi:adenylyltransferase/sulfurtransferase
MKHISQSLTPQDQLRYNRQLNLYRFGTEGQLRLKNSRVLIAGAGGLGCPLAMYLSGAGVGSITVVDHDTVELSNIHRQIAYKTADINKPKAQSLVDTICGINPDLSYEVKNAYISEANARELLEGHDLVIDGTDNFPTKFLVADTCYALKVPLLCGSVHQYSAQIIFLGHENGPCLRCLFNQPPETGALAACDQAGVLGVVAGTVGMLMATEAIKFLSGIDDRILDRLIKYDALTQSLDYMSIPKDPDCPLCGRSPAIAASTGEQVTRPGGEFANSPQHPNTDSISAQTAAEMIDQGAFLLDVREPSEYQHSRLPNAVLIPLARLPEELTTTVPRDRPVVVYCQHGVRSLAAVNYMRSAGYKNSYSITGGIAAWPLCE